MVEGKQELPSDEEDDTMRGWMEWLQIVSFITLSDLEAQPSLEPEENEPDNEDEDEESFPLLQETPLHEITNSVIQSSLACLSARVVRKHGLEVDSLPVTLQAFVLTH